MDSVTQILLGSAVGQAVMGNRAGRKAIVWGAALGTLPDLDVLVPYGGAVADFTYHRSFSHSLLVQALVTPLIVWLILKIHPHTREHQRRWLWLVLLVLWTHSLLDGLTVYGTQMFWPLSEFPVAISSVFIIDPLYTLPLMVGVIAAVTMGQRSAWTNRLNSLGLILSTLYLGWGLAAKVLVDQRVETALADRGIVPVATVSTPAPLNTLLWRIMVMADDHYYEGYLSVFDGPDQLSLTRYPNELALLNSLENQWEVQRLQWFTKGFFRVREVDGRVIISDLRMGVEGSYVFNFEVGKRENSAIVPGSFTQVAEPRDLERISAVWERIWDPTVSLSPGPALVSSELDSADCMANC